MYDVIAKVPAGTTKEQSLLMLQNLLAERFRLQVHRETREGQVYALVVDKHGTRLKPAEGPRALTKAAPDGKPISKMQIGADGFPEFSSDLTQTVVQGFNGRWRMQAVGLSMNGLAERLTLYLSRPVLDMTALSGRFDFTLTWVSESLILSESSANAIEPGPTVFTALEQVGLKLEARKGPIEVLVVDHADRVPTEN